MTEDQKPSQKKNRRSRQGEASNEGMTDASIKTPPLNPGPGRKRLLDPDQHTLEQNIKLLYELAPQQATLEETAAVLSVSLDTLHDFFDRFPTVKEMYDDRRLTGQVSMRARINQLFTTSPALAKVYVERRLGMEDPYKRKELELQEREFARRQEEFVQSMELKSRELAQRERALALREERYAKANPFRSRVPINIRDLDGTQVAQLLERIKLAKQQLSLRTIEGNKKPPE